MNEPPNKNHDPMQDANRMLNQVTSAFSLPWPRKPLSGSKGAAKGAKGPGSPASRGSRLPGRTRRKKSS